MVQKVAVETVRCHILLTNTAREAIQQHVQDEQAFFRLQKNFIVYIEKLAIEQTQLALTLYFDNEKNRVLKEKFQERVVIMDCVFDLKNGLVAKSFRTRGKGTPVATNRRERLLIHFVPSRISGHTYPDKFIETLAALPVAQERFDYVNKRITSWEGYLKVLNQNADIEDIEAKFTTHTLNADFTHITFICSEMNDKEWKQLKGLSARVRGLKLDLGEVVKVNRGARAVEIALKPDAVRLARKNELHFEMNTIDFSNASTKSQLNRLLKGFDRLKEGLAENANLENILFEDKPVIAAHNADVTLDFHNQLNEFQRKAVTGAMSAEDLYVIQGPPGTGKTTVISEICYQNAKAGLKTLVASQSNLAVDNALSRLLSNKDIRILRYGRTESIEEEGKKFIEENVATYWQQQTYEAISLEVSQQQDKKQLLEQEIIDYEAQLTQLQEEKIKLQQDIERKQQAEEQLKALTEKIIALKKQLVPLKKEREQAEEQLERLEASKAELTASITTYQEQLVELPTVQELEALEQSNTEQLTQLSEAIQAAEISSAKQQLEQQLASVTGQLQHLSPDDGAMERLTTQITELKKVQDVEDFIVAHQIRRSFVIDRLLASLSKLQPEIAAYKPIKDLSERLEKALAYSEKALQIHVTAPPLPPNHTYSINEVQEFLTKLSHAFAERKINAQNGARSIQGVLLRKAYVEQLQVKYQDLLREVMLIFTKLKEELVDLYKEQLGQSETQVQQLRSTEQQLQQKLQQLKDVPAIDVTVEELQQQRNDLEHSKQQLAHQKMKQATLTVTYEAKTAELQQVNEQLTHGNELIQSLKEQLKEINSTGLALEKEREELEQLTKQNPEAALSGVEQRITATQAEIAKTEQRLELLPVTQQLQSEWKIMLENASEHDLEEIRKLYVKHANVIGTTCVASANKEFMDNYPTFDVVIIDEVSKATPPELLLPMLKGKKIILVGDHHQLPPLIGDETFEETLEQVIKNSDTFEEKRELEKMLEESLFERLYKNLPQSNKTMLAIQYRMHEKIMKTIVPFYKNEHDALQCGLPDSDKARDHLLETPLFNRQNHLLWLDIPHDQAHFEERMKEGASLFNRAELEKVKELLTSINEATKQAKEQGLLPQDAQKSVGVISFYAEQVKRINEMVEQGYPHLHIRTGSVDKFQGMEMDVIIVSMVRNHDGQGSIGFAQDYRRLNVALSRARELLIMVGSTEMFTKRPKKQETRQMYQHVLDVVKAQDGYRA
ncbi:AAA domain-containing protein [Lysinibacillus louembei]|uniref:AAA domain-containing protein n=1 Tax=Lysinibacillus louembei TaxID=1470088 RepID=A0ABZ0RUT9_9BACI|nr:AAA domain-containing protein [Lysinibacillus louembei]WPK11071.1 AAA domain-containing protein [Lysinibacillus louembei]